MSKIKVVKVHTLGPTHFGNIGSPRFPKWAHLWCVVLVKPCWKFWLAHISIMGVVLVCGFGETILEILARPYIQYGLTCGVWFSGNHNGNMGEPMLEKLAGQYWKNREHTIT